MSAKADYIPAPPPKGIKTCKDCRFLGSDRLGNDNERVIVCRRRPPDIPELSSTINPFGYWPIVNIAEDWCGDFEWTK